MTALLFGVAPALHATRIDVLAALKDEAGGVTGASAIREVAQSARCRADCTLRSSFSSAQGCLAERSQI